MGCGSFTCSVYIYVCTGVLPAVPSTCGGGEFLGVLGGRAGIDFLRADGVVFV